MRWKANFPLGINSVTEQVFAVLQYLWEGCDTEKEDSECYAAIYRWKQISTNASADT